MEKCVKSEFWEQEEKKKKENYFSLFWLSQPKDSGFGSIA